MTITVIVAVVVIDLVCDTSDGACIGKLEDLKIEVVQSDSRAVGERKRAVRREVMVFHMIQ